MSGHPLLSLPYSRAAWTLASCLSPWRGRMLLGTVGASSPVGPLDRGLKVEGRWGLQTDIASHHAALPTPCSARVQRV